MAAMGERLTAVSRIEKDARVYMTRAFVMAKDRYDLLMKSAEWRSCRNAYVKSVRGMCEDCMKQGIYTPGEQVHHIVKITPKNIDDPHIVFGWNNLVLLCKACHDKRHGKLKPKADFITGHVEI